MNTQNFKKALLPFALIFSALPAQAQTAPDAGSLQQQIERERKAPLPPVSPKLKAPLPGEKPAVSGPTVTVTRFEFAGNTLLPAERLEVAVTSYLNRPLTFVELQEAAAAVAEVYRDAGWVVRTYLPRQDLSSGIVRIEIVEAVLGTIRIDSIDPAQPLRVSEERIQAMAAKAQLPGQPINTRAVDRALLLLDDLPGVAVQGSLGAGKGDRETDLLLKIANEPFYSGDVRADNTGSRSTGPERLTGNLAFVSPSGNADLLGLNLLYTEGSAYVRMAYALPVGYDGLTAGINASGMRYRLVGADFAALHGRGSSNTAGAELNYPLIRSRPANLMLNVSVEHKDFDNESGGVTTTLYNIDALTLTLNGNLFDAFGGGGRTSASLGVTQGNLNLAGSPNFADDARATRTAGRYGKLRYTLSRQQAVSEDVSLIANLSGQVAGKNLDSAEKFYLGGAGGVRAYPASEGGGSEGEMLNLELHVRLPGNFKVLGFYDWGQVRVNRDNDFAKAPALNSLSLQGAGLSLAWEDGKGFNARLTWAHRIGSNPNPTAAGNDQDGTLTMERIWLSAGFVF